MAQNPKVVFASSAWYKMFAYTRAVGTEISGFGIVEQKPNCLYVPDVFIFEQKASTGGVEIHDEAIHKWMLKVAKDGSVDLSKVRLWWHSHNHFNVFRSGTDEATVKRLLFTMPWLLCVVTNKIWQHRTSVHLKEPYPMVFDKLSITVDRGRGDIESAAAEEARKLVKPDIHHVPLKTERKKEPEHGYPLGAILDANQNDLGVDKEVSFSEEDYVGDKGIRIDQESGRIFQAGE